MAISFSSVGGGSSQSCQAHRPEPVVQGRHVWGAGGPGAAAEPSVDQPVAELPFQPLPHPESVCHDAVLLQPEAQSGEYQPYL